MLFIIFILILSACDANYPLNLGLVGTAALLGVMYFIDLWIRPSADDDDDDYEDANDASIELIRSVWEYQRRNIVYERVIAKADELAEELNWLNVLDEDEYEDMKG